MDISVSRDDSAEMEWRGRLILEAMALVVYERGYARASVGAVSRCAKVSTRTFYEHFNGLQECFLALLEYGTMQVMGMIAEALEGERYWVDIARDALARVLMFFDARPALAYVLLVEAGAAGVWAREQRETHIASVMRLVEPYGPVPEGGPVHPLVNSGVMASLLGLLQSHLVHKRREPLITLLGPLMGLVTGPYLEQAAVRREVEHARALGARLAQAWSVKTDARVSSEPSELPGLLSNPRSRRARACLMFLVENPDASNREVARAVGIDRRTQISTLLARLAGMGLVEKHSTRRGGPNAWRVTARGIAVARELRLVLDK